MIGNGDIRTPADALRMVRETGCDAVMIGRGASSNPWIFRQIEQFVATGTYDEPTDIDRYHLLPPTSGICIDAGLPDAIGKMKQFASLFTHGVAQRRGTAPAGAYRAHNSQEVLDRVDAFFAGPATRANPPRFRAVLSSAFGVFSSTALSRNTNPTSEREVRTDRTVTRSAVGQQPLVSFTFGQAAFTSGKFQRGFPINILLANDLFHAPLQRNVAAADPASSPGAAAAINNVISPRTGCWLMRTSNSARSPRKNSSCILVSFARDHGLPPSQAFERIGQRFGQAMRRFVKTSVRVSLASQVERFAAFSRARRQKTDEHEFFIRQPRSHERRNRRRSARNGHDRAHDAANKAKPADAPDRI